MRTIGITTVAVSKLEPIHYTKYELLPLFETMKSFRLGSKHKKKSVGSRDWRSNSINKLTLYKNTVNKSKIFFLCVNHLSLSLPFSAKTLRKSEVRLAQCLIYCGTCYCL